MDAARSGAGVLLGPFVWRVRQVRHQMRAEPVLSLWLLLVLLFCILRAVRGDRLAALALVPLSVAWALFNGSFEGPTLLVLTGSHGITGSDLIAAAGLLVAAWRLSPVLAGR